AIASRLPPDPRRLSEPFAKPKPVESSHRWKTVDRGLGNVRLGLLLMVLGVLVPSAILILEANGVALPDRDPGFFGVAGVALSGEIKVGAAMLFFTLGRVLLTLGRFQVGRLARETGARGLAKASAYATLIAFAGFIVIVVLGLLATL